MKLVSSAVGRASTRALFTSALKLCHCSKPVKNPEKKLILAGHNLIQYHGSPSVPWPCQSHALLLLSSSRPIFSSNFLENDSSRTILSMVGPLSTSQRNTIS